MENKPTNLEELFEKFREYADTRIDLFKLKGIQKVSGFMSTAYSKRYFSSSAVYLLYFVLQ